MSEIRKPDCLHIPTLYEGETALFYWEEVEGAVAYQLDVIYDNTFANAPAGLRWKDIDALEKTWTDVEQCNMSWDAFEQLVPSFGAYRGPGKQHPMPGQGLPWSDIERFGGNWQQMENRELSWKMLEAIWERGRTWENLDARHASWDEMDARAMSWGDFERLSIDNRPHRACVVEIEPGASFAQVRLRAVGAKGECSAYVVSPRHEIMAMAELKVTTQASQPVRILTQGLKVDSLADSLFTVLYNGDHLRFEGLQLKAAGHNLPLSRGLQVKENKKGSLQFTSSQFVPQGQTISNLLAMLCFVALKDGTTTLRLKRKLEKTTA